VCLSKHHKLNKSQRRRDSAPSRRSEHSPRRPRRRRSAHETWRRRPQKLQICRQLYISYFIERRLGIPRLDVRHRCAIDDHELQKTRLRGHRNATGPQTSAVIATPSFSCKVVVALCAFHRCTIPSMLALASSRPVGRARDTPHTLPVWALSGRRGLMVQEAGTVDELAQLGGGLRAAVKPGDIPSLKGGPTNRVGQLYYLVGKPGKHR
jgi:hypothetical protein